MLDLCTSLRAALLATGPSTEDSAWELRAAFLQHLPQTVRRIGIVLLRTEPVDALAADLAGIAPLFDRFKDLEKVKLGLNRSFAEQIILPSSYKEATKDNIRHGLANLAARGLLEWDTSDKGMPNF